MLEGASRPTHFHGVLTVVAKLLGLVRPDVAVFGEKDYQQLALIRRMVSDLCLGVDVVGAETVREPDGLALSCATAYLDPDRPALGAGPLRAPSSRPRDAAGRGADQALAAARARAGRCTRCRPRLPRAHRTRPRPGPRRPARPGCWSPPGSAPPA